MVGSSTKYQYLSAFAVSCSSILYGISCGWTSPTFPILESVETPLPIGPLTPDELSLIGSMVCLGGLAGTLTFGNIVDFIGRKACLCLLSVPNFISFALILWAQDANYLYAARFFAGFAAGGVFVVAPLYIAEIAESHIRGALGSNLILFYNVGVLFAFVIGNYCDYRLSAMIYLACPIIYLLGVIFLPDSPPYLMKKNRPQQAEQSLAFFRNVRKDFKDATAAQKFELEILKNQKISSANKDGDKSISYRDFVTRKSLKAIFIGLVLLFVNQGCGIFAMLNYIGIIFEEAGSALSGNMSAIVVGSIQVLGAYVSTFLVDKAGRKFCLGISSLSIGAGYIVMGIYLYLKVLEFNVSSFSWIPVASFSFVVFTANCGLQSLPFVLISEIMPDKIRSYCQTICLVFLYIIAFIFVRYFYILSESIGLHGSVFLFAFICILGSIFIAFVVPETKGKTLEEIQNIL